MGKDFYQVLGVPRDADTGEIKKAYRKLAMEHHPDRNPGNAEAESKFREAANAYEVLSDPEKRSRYDRFGEAGLNGFSQGGFSDPRDIFSAFSDIFEDFFGGGRGRSGGQHRGADLRYRLTIDLADTLAGLEKDIEFQSEQTCGKCSGTGAAEGYEPETCNNCHGRGQVVRSQGFFSLAMECPTCHGRGRVIKKSCKSCRGSGRETVKRKVNIKVPAGIDSGIQLRVTGEGEGGHQNGPAGDLYVEIMVRPHKGFQRQNDHLVSKIEISYLQALLGAELNFESLDKNYEISIPAGSQPGDIVRVPQAGIPNLRSGRRGDLLLQVQVIFPKKLKKQEEQLLRQIADLKDENVQS